ncbi:MBL fold metallo-hydrolase [Gammaproteobacteria bacterium]|nr:MBL fold metallo-hydrolase [Gammaproteobacteria bacterium]MDA9143577.1 MBL fold metallo-hydrolase [Gammaproteobacteria bacterium]
MFILLKQPWFQDRLLQTALENLSTPVSNLPNDDSLTAVVCGSRSPINDPNRAEACILVQAGEQIFIFDTGNGSAQNLNNWNIPWNKVKGIFYTHLHSDHISDIADFHVATWINGQRDSKQKVYGPEGVQLLTDGIEMAYTKDYFFRNEHHGDVIAPLDIAGFDAHTVDLENPILVDSNGLKITAYSVSHDPVDPALGYRIDYKGRSISISGDTIYDKNLVQNSKNVDVLFHESMSLELLDLINKNAKETNNFVADTVTIDILDYHTPVLDVVKAAKEADVRHLVFYHHLPAPRNQLMEDVMYRGVDEIMQEWTASHDGTMIILPLESDKIIITSIK